jgi:FkbM family methyltransferase
MVAVDEVFESHAQNGEDIILWRALNGVTEGRFIDVGANDPAWFSISKAFYDHGWRGIDIEPSHHFAQLLREHRPGDIVVEAAVSARSGERVTLHEIDETGLSTLVDDIRDRHAGQGWKVTEVQVETTTLNDVLESAEWDGLDIHFMTVDVEGSEGAVLESIDLHRWRPWVLVVESTAPLTTSETHSVWEPRVLAAGYQYCLFDGLSRYYVADEHFEALGHQLSYSPSVFDSFSTHDERELTRKLATATHDADVWRTEAASWRARALANWSESITRQNQLEAQIAHLSREVDSLRHTLSWRVTAPLRAVRRRMPTAPTPGP